MKRKGIVLVVILAAVAGIIWVAMPLFTGGNQTTEREADYYGSVGCKQCHERFYELWGNSHHGLAMQNITPEFVKTEVLAQSPEIAVDSSLFYVENQQDSLVFIENGPDGKKEYTATFALGGKNVYYFLTPFEKGRLQVLPLAYDLNKKEWYNNPESAMRHFTEGEDDEALPWKHIGFTFNTSCYSCHVSQLENNFNQTSNSYHTTWKENGINCETCHGPSAEHVRVCMEAGEGNVPEDLKIIVTSTFTHEQQNASCAPCHAKMSPITSSYPPGERFFDHYNLTTIESRDFYPDGRDLGENYTHTSWMMSDCTQSGQLDCVHCHTSSGRYRFKNENFNDACASCHSDIATNLEAHTHHPVDSEGSRCISCHMPMTEFARMHRSDHSMRPPAPLATKEFGSPNSCNICHDDKTPDWANQHLVEWNKTKHQEELLVRGRLMRQARDNNWKQLDQMLAFVDDGKFDEVFTNSMIRLLQECEDTKKWPTIYRALKHESPLVRASAAVSFSYQQLPGVVDSLLPLTSDDYRLVRVLTAEALSTLPDELLEGKRTPSYTKALDEYITSRTSRPDDWAAHAALGNYYFNRNDFNKALSHFTNSSKIYPENIGAFVNSGLIHSMTGQPEKAEQQFKEAIKVDPSNEATNLNYALLLGEMGKLDEAEKMYRKVLDINEASAVAAFNLSVLVAPKNPNESLGFAQKAWELQNDNPKYGYTYGYYLFAQGQKQQALKTLESVLKLHPDYVDTYFLLADLYTKDGQTAKAKTVLGKGVANENLQQQVRVQMQQLLSQK